MLTHQDLAELQQKVGRNLLRYQQIEIRLKALLPFRKITASAEGLEQLKRDIADCQKKTLGLLIPDYVDGMEFAAEAHKIEFQAALTQLLRHRNELVHKLIDQIGPVESVEGLEPTLRKLDEQYEYAESVAIQIRDVQQFIGASVSAHFERWASSAYSPQAMWELSRRTAERLTEQFGDDVQLEIQIPVLELLREQMQVLWFARHAEGEWAPFSRVIDQLREVYSLRVPKLLSYARQLADYQIAFRPVRPGAGSTWMYRPIAPSDVDGNVLDYGEAGSLPAGDVALGRVGTVGNA